MFACVTRCNSALCCGAAQVRELDVLTLRWRRVEAGGTPPPFRIHSRCWRPAPGSCMHVFLER